MKCDKCANYLSGLDRCKFCSFEEDKSADHRLDAIRHWYESVMHQKLFGHGFHPNVITVGNPKGFYECEYEFEFDNKGDNMIEDIKINYDNVTVNGVKAKSFTMNSSDGEIAVEWKEDFNLRELIEKKGINNGVNKRLDRYGVDYVDCFYDRFISMLYIRTNDISLKNKSDIIDCLNIDARDVSILSDTYHSIFDSWGSKGWFAIRVE